MGLNFVKIWWIKTKIELDLQLSMAKQCAKYQMNIIYKQREKKCRKLIIRDIFVSPRDKTSWKNQWIKTNLKVDLYLVVAKQYIK
jgi:hypothetical protein